MLHRLTVLVVALCLFPGGALHAADVAGVRAKPDPNNPNKLTKERVVKVLRTTNKAQVNRYVPKVYELKHVNPASIFKFIQDAVSTEEGLFDTYVHPDGNSGLLLVSVPEYQIPMIDRVIAELDRPGLTAASGTKFAYVQFKHRNTSDPDIAATLLAYGADDNITRSDPDANALYLVGSPSGIDSILSAVQVVDVPSPQVNVAATIYELDVTSDGKLGLDYFAWKNGPGRALFSIGAFGEYDIVGEAAGNGWQQYDSGVDTLGLPGNRFASHGYHGAYFYDVPSAYFDFLVVKGKGKVLTESNVTVNNTAAALFKSVEEIMYFETQTVNAAQANPLPQPPGEALLVTGSINDRRLSAESESRSPVLDSDSDINANSPDIKAPLFFDAKDEYIDTRGRYLVEEAGVVTIVTPTVATENVDLEIYTRVVDMLGFDGEGRPQLSTREAQAEVRAQDGEEVVLGGLKRDREIKNSNKMPFIGSLPVLGYMFGGETTTKKVTTVIEVVTPTCIEGCAFMTEAQRETIRKATGELVVETGRDDYGFEQYIIGRPKYED